ncbi:MAG TPA: phospho-sugar mutase, partial [Frankiaceae bacterium]|nr:phospho-sugar mutase [Frankiaceae bacterium]
AVTLPRDGGVLLRLDGGRVLVRPSGTEPTVKAYLELIRPVRGPVAEARRAAAAELDRLAIDV